MMDIREDDLAGPEIRALLEQHFAGMLAASPPGTCHFLDFDGLTSAGVTFWSIWEGDKLTGCGALKEHDPTHAEIKSMRVSDEYLGQGVGYQMLAHILNVAKMRGYRRVSLETGTSPDFEAAHALYRRSGFDYCGPFGDYEATSFNSYMTMELS